MTGDERYADVARGVLRYVLRDMTDTSGGFYSAEDADSLPFEGAAMKKEVRGIGEAKPKQGAVGGRPEVGLVAF